MRGLFVERLTRLMSRRNESESPVSERFAEGSRSLRDLVAPSAIETKASHLAIDGRYLKVLALADYPRYVHPNWLGRLIDFDQPRTCPFTLSRWSPVQRFAV